MAFEHVLTKLRYLLLQARNRDDPMRSQEVECFARALQCDLRQIDVVDLLSSAPSDERLSRADVVLLGGSGHYSAVGEDVWLLRAMDALRGIHDQAKSTFASCWGFQAMARALGGRVIHDLPNAELGTIDLHVTPAGQRDPVFGHLGSHFLALAGHEYHAVELPPGAVLLASSDRVAHQAYRMGELPIYCTQFHAELRVADLQGRVQTYPEYVERITGGTIEEFIARCQETPEMEALLLQFVRHFFGE